MNRKYLIGEIAKYFDISTDTLRYYHKQGILSPNKDKSSGYRYYTYDDIIKLTYLLTLKNLDVKLVDIKKILTNCTLEELKNAVEEQHQIIEQKINNLNNLKKTIENFKDNIDLSLNLYNKYEIVQSATLLYKVMDDNFGEKITKEIKALEESGLANRICYTAVISKECFKSDSIEKYIYDGISGVLEGKVNSYVDNYYNLYKSQKSIHTIIKVMWSDPDSYFSETNLSFLEVKKYIADNGYTVINNILCRYITFETNGTKSTDYIEVWIPIK